jgi:chitin deacetylase
MIGINIIQNPSAFQAAFMAGHDIGVHTWTHPYMTTLSNLDVVAQVSDSDTVISKSHPTLKLGWTAELIRNSTGGRLPRFWRPPYGDSDNRVRAIAKEVVSASSPDVQPVIWFSFPRYSV